MVAANALSALPKWVQGFPETRSSHFPTSNQQHPELPGHPMSADHRVSPEYEICHGRHEHQPVAASRGYVK